MIITVVFILVLNSILKYINIMAVITTKNKPLFIFVRMILWILNQIWVFLGSL